MATHLQSTKVDRFSGRSLNVHADRIASGYRQLARAIIRANIMSRDFLDSRWCMNLADLAEIDYGELVRSKEKKANKRQIFKRLRHPPELITAAVKDFLEGNTLAYLSKKYNIRGQTISYWKRKYGNLIQDGKPLPVLPPLTPEEREKIARDILENRIKDPSFTYIQESKKYYISGESLRNIVHEYKRSIGDE